MFNLEKREKFIILALLTFLIAGLLFALYQRSMPSINVKVDAFGPDSDLLWQAKKTNPAHSSVTELSSGIGGVNINEADLKDLEDIKGIGQTLAKRILEYRSKNGNFRSTEELKKVKGIGQKLFERIKDKVCID